MRIENGKLVLEMRKCWNCEGTGTKEELKPCPNYNIPYTATKKKPCQYCGARYKGSHNYLKTGNIISCDTCKGKKELMETRFDSISQELWQSIKFIVIRSCREMDRMEGLLGAGAYTCTDYGRHKALTDEQLIATVKEEKHVQACKLVKEDMTVMGMAIYTSDMGYSVICIPPDMEPTIKELAAEQRHYYDAKMIRDKNGYMKTFNEGTFWSEYKAMGHTALHFGDCLCKVEFLKGNV